MKLSGKMWLMGAFVVVALLSLVVTSGSANASGRVGERGGAEVLAQTQTPLVRTYTETQVNQYFQGRLAYLKPVDAIALRFVPGQVQANVGAYGVSGTVYGSLAASNGRIVTVNPQVYGFLGWFVSGATAAPYLDRQINAFVNPYGTYTVTAVQVLNQAVTVMMVPH